MRSLTSNHGLLAIEVRPNGVAFAYNPNPSKPTITVCEFHPHLSSDTIDNGYLREILTETVTKYRLKKSNCILMLHPNYYYLTLADTPQVPESEYKEAIRWQMKEIVSYSLEDLAVDIFYPHSTKEQKNKIYVIAAQNSALQNAINVIQDCELYPIAVDICEFAARNLISKITAPEETISFLNIVENTCIAILVKENTIQFARHIPIGLNNIKDDDYTELTTEITRSFTYCETEYELISPEKIFMPPIEDPDSTIAQKISENLHKEISTINLQDIVEFKSSINQQIVANCWSAIGGILRNTKQVKK